MRAFKVFINFPTFILFLGFFGLAACTKYVEPEWAGNDLAGAVCNRIHYKCDPNSGSVDSYQNEVACSEKLKAEIKLYMESNQIKIAEKDFGTCLESTRSLIDCEALAKGEVTVPEGCEALSGWFTK